MIKQAEQKKAPPQAQVPRSKPEGFFDAGSVLSSMFSTFKARTERLISVGKPEFVGRIPVRTELEILPPHMGSSEGEKEFAEHGSIALRFPMSHDAPGDNRMGSSWRLGRGGTVLIRAKAGGFFLVPMEKDRSGWFVRLGTERHKVRVLFDDQRGFWVAKELR